MTREEYLADLHRERYGSIRGLWRESAAQPLPPPVDGPRDWIRRQRVLLDALDDCGSKAAA